MFLDCDGFTDLSFLNQVTTIGSYAFEGCDGFAELVIPDTVTVINDHAFMNCMGLQRVTFGSGLESIGANAFEDCTGLTEITIPDNVTSIGEGAFAGCSGLTAMTIPFVGGSADATASSASTLFGYIFGNSSYEGATEVVQQYFAYRGEHDNCYYIPAGLTSVTVTGGEILYGAFYNCAMLTSITLPDDITAIGEKAFYNCDDLTSIEYIGTTAEWEAISKGDDWSYGITATEVICSDGVVSLN